MVDQVRVALSQDFLSQLSKLPNAVQGRVIKWSMQFQANPKATGINYEKINAARDPHLRSVRIDQDYRGIVFKPDSGDLYILLHVDKHDDAYAWAERRKLAVNPVTGSLQVFVAEQCIEPAPVATPNAVSASADAASPPLFGHLSDHDLTALGMPPELIPAVREVHSEGDLDRLQSSLPVEAYEGLFLVAAGDTVTQVLNDRQTRVDTTINVEDFATAVETPESLSRFAVVDTPETMAALLNAPLAQWRIFLHPTQRRLAEGDKSGPYRVLGGAGTGKTVLAIHRARWLAQHRADERKVLFTTYTRNLAIDIEENLRTLCNASELSRIEVRNLDAWVHSYLKSNSIAGEIVYDRERGIAGDVWKRALSARPAEFPELDETFFSDELDHVVLAQGIQSEEAYLTARRAGRGVVLSRAKRKAIWPVFEEYRASLGERGLIEADDAYGQVADHINRQAEQSQPAGPRPYASVIIDETQDFGPQALRLIRALAPVGSNDLFFVGDGHQRIYSRHRAAMSRCGIDIRGRARKLYLNYRTTEEIRRHAVACLEACEIDDLDDGSDESKRYKSIAHGAEPEVVAVTSLTAAIAAIDARLPEPTASVCVIVPTNMHAKAVMDGLIAAGRKVRQIHANERDDPRDSSVRVATMHRAKGLEFDEVILYLPAGWADGWLDEDENRKLQYVALTRAKRRATVVHA